MAGLSSVTIDKFRGLNTTKEELSLIPGQLSKNQNYLYMASGGLKERGGGVKLSSPPAVGKLYSLDNYVNENGLEFLITNQGTDSYYYSSGWNALSLTLTSNLKTRWAQAGSGSLTALYGVNGTDSVIKISGVTPTGSLVASSPTTCTDIERHKNRLFAIDDTSLYFTEVLDYDTWNTGTNKIDIAPGVDGKCTALEVWGDSLFIFKEYGVYVLPNASDPTPTTSWLILRTDAAMGTNSPDTVKRTKNGIYYLSTDNFIRNLSPVVTFSSGEFTLGGSGTPIISLGIESVLEDDLSDSNKKNASAIVFNDLYIISFKTVKNIGSYNNVTYFADTNKFIQYEGVIEPQPYWGQFTGYDYDYFTSQLDSGLLRLYGAKGASNEGEVHETLNNDINNDDGKPINSVAILGWLPIGGESIYKKIKQIYFVGDTEDWDIELTFNAYKFNTIIPSDGEGTQRSYRSKTGVSSFIGTAILGTSIMTGLSTGSERFRTSLKGYYFKAEMKNQNANEFTRIDKIVVYYRPIKNK